jgi:hypothetical protein
MSTALSVETTDQAEREPFPLPDSSHGYWRSWCVVCDEPVRVSKGNVERPVCDDCSDVRIPPPYKAGITPRQATALAKLSGLDVNDLEGM